MKKLYVSLFSLAIAFGVNAQNAQVLTGRVKSSSQPVALEQPTSTPSVAATGDTINGYYYDFSNAAAWTLGNAGTPSADWEITTTGPTGEFSESYGPLESSTAGNGWAMFDSDALGSGTSVQDAWIQLANPVDLTGFSSVAVSFQQFYRRFGNCVTSIGVSTDGTAWTYFEVNAPMANNTSTANPENALVNISTAAGNQAQVWIRFRYQGAWDYFWQIDDVAIVEGATNDLVLSDVWHGDILTDWEYQQIPLSQAQEVVIGVAAMNQGGSTQTEVEYTYDISLDGSSVASGTFDATNASLASGASDTTWFSSGYTPSAEGAYTVTVSVASAEGDENLSNNEGSSSFVVSEFIYGHDDIDNIEFQISGGNDDNDSPNEFKAGLHYAILQDAMLHSVQVAFGANTTTSAVYVEVFDAADLATPLVTEVYDLEAGDISSGANIVLVDILIDGGDGLQLSAGTTYFISIGNTGPGESLWILASDGDDDRAQLRYGPFGVGGAVDWYTGYTDSPIIRANFDPTVSITENQDLTGIQMFPNPSNNVLTVKFNANESNDILVNVVSMDGKVVYTQSVNAFSGQFTSRIGLDGLSSGLYSVQVISNNATHTEKVAVVK